MDYKKHYDLLIETRRNRVIIDGNYYEKHHIIPKSMGGGDDPNNLIKLTAREHFIAHWLLWRIYQNKEMAFAFHSLVHMGKNQIIKSSRVYEESKIARRQFIVENNKIYHKGKKLSKKQIDDITNMFQNLVRSGAHCENISKSLKNKVKTKEHRENLSKSLKNYDWSNHTERNKKISISNSGEKNGRSKKVYMRNIGGDLLKEFNTMFDAMEYFNIDRDEKISKTTFWRKCNKSLIIDDFYFSFV